VPPATPAALKVIRNRQPTVAGFSNAAYDAKAADATQAAPAAQSAQPAEAATEARGGPAAVDAVSKAQPGDVRAVKTVMTDTSAQPTTAAAAMAPPPQQRRAADRLGLVMHALSADEKRSTGLPLGLMVDASIGPAATAGVRPGDVVLSLNDTLIESQADATALEAKATNSMSLLIQRNNARSFVAVKLR
jgi:membrane-associated protease RseP (regulator of RpoE activity)